MPTLGLLLFAAGTYTSYRDWRTEPPPRRYFWWSAYRLDSDPLNRHPRPIDRSGTSWHLVDKVVDPGLLAISFVLSGLPAFLLSKLIVAALSCLGISQVLTFMISTPILLFAWYYFLAWLLGRWRRKPHSANR